MTEAVQPGRFSIEREVVRLSMPMLIGMFFELLATLLDIFWIARINLDDTALVSGVGLTYPIPFLLVALAQGISAGIATIVAIAVGRGDQDYLHKVGKTGFNLSFYSSLIIVALVYVFSRGIVALLAGEQLSPAAQEYAVEYLAFYMPGVFFLFCAQALLAVLQGKGSTKYIGIAMSVSTIINAILDPIFIFGLGYGVKGAAMTTSIAQVLLFGFALMAIYKEEKHLLAVRHLRSFDFVVVKEILKLGIPQSISFIIMSASFAVVNWFISSVSETFMNSYTIVNRFDGILITPPLAFSIGLSILIGQTYGAGDIKSLRTIFMRGTGVNLLVSVLTGLLYMALARVLFTTMTDNLEVVSLATRQVYALTIISTIGSVLGLAAGHALQAVERPVQATFIMFLRMLLITVPLMILLRLIFGETVQNVWISLASGGLIGGVIGFGMMLRHIGRLGATAPAGVLAAEAQL